MKIPEKNNDLRRYAFFHTFFRILGFVLWEAFWIGSALSYNQNHQTYPASRRFTGWRMVLMIAVTVVAGCLVFRMWRLVTDRTVCGVIVATGLSRSSAPASDSDTTGNDSDFRLNTVLTIQPSGKKKKRVRFEQKNGFYQYYHEQNRVVRFRGLPYPLHLDPNAPYGYVCSVCGAWKEHYTPRCERCNHTVIDPKDFRIE